MKNTEKRTLVSSFIIVLFAYSLAFIAAIIVFFTLKSFFPDLDVLLITFISDVLATLIIWGLGIVYKNASLYDPYWSVAPVVIILCWLAALKKFHIAPADLLFLIAISIWAIRLTLNWALRWEGLAHQDWRYTMLKRNSPRLWFFTNLFGINLIPTFVVFAALIPVYFGTISKDSVNFLTVFGFIICIAAVILQFVSDRQMDLFRRNNLSSTQHIDSGLWRCSRHPNYFAEITFWWGLWLMQLSLAFQMWFTVAGPIIVTLLFLFISIPMMEKHITASRPEYFEYKKRVSMLVPWSRFKNQE